MSHLFGPVRQIGYVVEHIDTAIDFWVHVMGCGPVFYFRSLPLRDTIYRGAPSTPRIHLALVQNGAIQVELVQQTNDAPSCYDTFRRRHGEGLHHLGYWTEHFDDNLARAESHGLVAEQHLNASEMLGLAQRRVYFEGTGHPGTVIALSDMRPGHPHTAFLRSVAQESQNWNGIDPVRLVDLR